MHAMDPSHRATGQRAAVAATFPQQAGVQLIEVLRTKRGDGDIAKRRQQEPVQDAARLRQRVRGKVATRMGQPGLAQLPEDRTARCVTPASAAVPRTLRVA
jgi:hypothetical protein